MSTEVFIERARARHGNAYDYSRVRYTNARTKVEIVCPVHGSFMQAPFKHLHGQGCPKCRLRERFTIEEFIARARAAHGDKYDYSRVRYVNNSTPVEVVCPVHGSFWQTPANHIRKQACGCPRCAAEARGYRQRKSAEAFIEESIRVHGDKYDYSRVQYVRNLVPVEIVCPEHGAFWQAPVRHLSGQRCPACSRESSSLKRFTPIDEFIERAVSVHGDFYDYSNVRYVGAREHVEVICPRHGPFHVTPDNHMRGKRCPICATIESRFESEVREFIESLGVKTEKTRTAISPYEIDIYIPDLLVGVECHGLYYHSSKFTTGTTRHLRKAVAAENAGIRLIQLFEDEWYYRRSAVKNLLVAAVGKADKVYARDCRVVALDWISAKTFLDECHIQGAPKGGCSLALLHDGRVVAVMVFSMVRSERGAVGAGWELTRYASSGVVVGGASRLFSEFVRLYSPKRVISYSDRRLFGGQMYATLGFEMVHKTRPNYYVLVDGARKHKSNFKKSRLKALLGERYDERKTERQMCEENEWFRVYDCGLVKWEWRALA